MEYDDLMKQAEEHNKKMHRTKDINVVDELTNADKVTIAKIIDNRIKETYGDMYHFQWKFQCEGYFLC